MKTLTKLALAAALLTSTVAARADWVNGYFRNNGTYVAPYYRTPANGIPYDNISYRGYLSQQPTVTVYAPRTMPCYRDSYVSTPYSVYGSSTRIGDTTFHNYSGSDGGYLSGTVTRIGSSTFVSIYGR